MNFIEAIIAISKRPDMELCDDETELDGRYPSICVYKDFSCIGKLDWPRDGKPARVDKEVITELKNKSTPVKEVIKLKRQYFSFTFLKPFYFNFQIFLKRLQPIKEGTDEYLSLMIAFGIIRNLQEDRG